jgi:hypothetical protein
LPWIEGQALTLDIESQIGLGPGTNFFLDDLALIPEWREPKDDDVRPDLRPRSLCPRLGGERGSFPVLAFPCISF